MVLRIGRTAFSKSPSSRHPLPAKRWPGWQPPSSISPGRSNNCMHSITLDWHSTIPDPAVLPPGIISSERAVHLVHAVWLAMLVAAGVLGLALPIAPEALLYSACLVFGLSLIWILASWFWLRGTLFEPYPLFMIAA